MPIRVTGIYRKGFKVLWDQIIGEVFQDDEVVSVKFEIRDLPESSNLNKRQKNAPKTAGRKRVKADCNEKESKVAETVEQDPSNDIAKKSIEHKFSHSEAVNIEVQELQKEKIEKVSPKKKSRSSKSEKKETRQAENARVEIEETKVAGTHSDAKDASKVSEEHKLRKSSEGKTIVADLKTTNKADVSHKADEKKVANKSDRGEKEIIGKSGKEDKNVNINEKTMKVEEKPKKVEEKPKKVEEKPKKVEEKPKKVEEKPKKVEEKPKKVEEKPKKVEEKPKKVEEKPKKVEEKPKKVEEKPKKVEDNDNDFEDFDADFMSRLKNHIDISSKPSNPKITAKSVKSAKNTKRKSSDDSEKELFDPQAIEDSDDEPLDLVNDDQNEDEDFMDD